MLLDVVRALAARTCESPICILGLARPELLEERPSFPGDRPTVSVLTLEALDGDNARTLLRNLSGELQLEEALRARVVATAGGNPLFIEQLFAMIAEGAAPGEEIALPMTIRVLLATRLERLGPGERAALERASIIGTKFGEDALMDLVPEEARGSLSRHLDSLIEKQLIRPERSLSGGKMFGFRHLLIQETTYRSMPKELRAGLHERLAAWIERTAGGEYEEIVGYHLEQSHRYWSELGPVRDKERELGDRAGNHLERAGRRAYARGDARAAINLLERARSLFSDDVKRVTCGLPLADAYGSVGELERASRLLAAVVEAADRNGDRRTAWLGRVQQAQVSELVAPQDWTPERAEQAATAALEVFGELEDDLGLARAWTLAGRLAWNQCRFDEAATGYGEALAHARRTGDTTTEAQALNSLIGAVNFGSTPAGDVRRQVEELLVQMPGHPAFEARAFLVIARQQALEGATEEARALYLRAKSLFEELGRTYAMAGAAQFCEEIALAVGDADFAERELRAAYEVLERMGADSVRSTIATYLGDALYALGRYDEAEEFARVSLEASAPDDVASQSRGRAVLAKVLAVRGDHDAAEHLAREAVELAADTDDLYSYARMLMGLADVLRLAERQCDAVPALESAVEVSERKGDLVTAARARAYLAEFQQAPSGTGSARQQPVR
jgi:tetratricopeptide (TPR) repeat protein